MQTELSPHELWERLHGKAEAPFFILDIRNDEEREAWKVEGPVSVPEVAVPYFAFIDDEEGSLARVPEDLGQVVVICPRGGSSDYVAGVLQDAGRQAVNLAGGMVAWGDLQVPLRVRTDGPFELWQISRYGKGCLSYAIIAGGEAAIVDPSRFPEVYERLVAERGARIVEVLETHVHADHLTGGPALAQRTGARYRLVAGTEREAIDGVQIEPIDGTTSIRIGGEGGVTIDARAFPLRGPVSGSAVFLVDGKHLLSGDALSVRGIARPGTAENVGEWGRMLHRILGEVVADLPDDTEVLPGHFTGVAEEDGHGLVRCELGKVRAMAPELRVADPAEFVTWLKAGMKDAPAICADIIKANLGKVDPGEKASEWELGRIECCAVARF